MERESECPKCLSGWEVVDGPVVRLFDGRLLLKKLGVEANNEEEVRGKQLVAKCQGGTRQ